MARLFEGVLHSARAHLCRAEEPLAAEVWASGLLAVWDGPPGREDEERGFGEALVRHTGAAGTPEAVGVLLALAAVASSVLAARAASVAAALVVGGVAVPAWAAEVGRAAPTAAWIASDAQGDQEILLIGFSYPRGGEHTLCVLVDRNLGGTARDAYLAAAFSETLPRWQEAQADGITLRPSSLAEVAGRLDDALRARDVPRGVSSRLAEMRPLLVARLALLPCREAAGQAEGA